MDWFLYDNGLRHERVKCPTAHGPILLQFTDLWRHIVGGEAIRNLE